MTDLRDLSAPFNPAEIEWRVGQAGMKGDKVWAKVLAYITNRAIMDRLDAVVGPGNWRNEYRYEAVTTANAKDGEERITAILCGLSIRVDGEWVTKWDGAENTDIEAVKGGLSNAMKRAAVQWGIGRYLYDLEEGWANVHDGGKHWAPKNDRKGIPAFKWDPPNLPNWALPVTQDNNTASSNVGHQEAQGRGVAPRDTGASPVAVTSAKKSGTKSASLKQANVDALLKKAHGQLDVVQDIVARIIPGSKVSAKADTWPMMDSDQYHAIVEAIDTHDYPEAIITGDLEADLRERLKNTIYPAKERVRILAELDSASDKDEVTSDMVRTWISQLIPMAE